MTQKSDTRPIPQSVLDALAANDRAAVALAHELKAEMDVERPSYAISHEPNTPPLVGQKEEQES